MSPDEWRGACLNYFARFEAAVASALEAARYADPSQEIRHLAGQRLADLIKLSENVAGTNKQLKAFSTALAKWQEIEDRRQFLAHGVASVSHEPNQKWVLILYIKTYRKNTGTPDRWTRREHEADAFLQDLKEAFKAMSGQLGHFRKRLEKIEESQGYSTIK